MNSAIKRVVTSMSIGMALIMTQAPAVAGPGDVDKSGAAWWQWALSIPADTNPLLDTTGDDCMVGQRGGVWYLAGTFFPAPSTAVRDCAVPAGTAFFVPVINFVNVDAPNVCGQGPDHVPVGDLRAAVAPLIDGATNLSITVDGVNVNNMRRIKSGVFAVTFPDDNLFDALCGGPGTVPAGVYSPAIDDGYYAEVNALSAGAHVVHIHADSLGGFTLDITYNLNVVATINH